MEITQRGAEAPSLGPSGFISSLTECALPCRLPGEWGRADVVSADHGKALAHQGRQRIWSRGGGLGIYFATRDSGCSGWRAKFEYIVCLHWMAMMTEKGEVK